MIVLAKEDFQSEVVDEFIKWDHRNVPPLKVVDGKVSFQYIYSLYCVFVKQFKKWNEDLMYPHCFFKPFSIRDFKVDLIQKNILPENGYVDLKCFPNFRVSSLEDMLKIYNIFFTCENCGKEGDERLKECSRCKRVCYCDVNCQKKDWKKHKSICKEGNDINLKIQKTF